ncbi:MAG: hypothetical protein ACTHMC_17140 [Pseudobacter sp.]|uniref:hypothetical protein n=1 Tax=Pseudobacter sp. TaxID=2045420 RepID=UPI003F7D5966
MIKIARTVVYLLLAVTAISCKKDMMKDIDEGGWNHERSIINISVEHQVGLATVKRDENNNGLVSFMFNVNSGDISKVTIKSLELSVGASSDMKPGDQLNFDNPDRTAQIKVRSATGQERIWTLSFIPFTDELIGTWAISKLSVYGGAWPEYGGAAAFDDIAARDWNWKQDGTGPVAEYDNTLTFTLEGITETGDSYGKCFNDAGPDGKYAGFIFIDDPDGARNEIDVNGHYRQIPAGESSWKRNSAQGTITFTSASNKVTTGRFVGAGSEGLPGGLTVTVADHAFSFDREFSYVWIDIYKDREKLVENTRKYWIQVRKIN